MFKKFLFLILFLGVILCAGFFYFRSQVYLSHGERNSNIIFEVRKGESIAQVGGRLAEENVIKGKIYFLGYFLWNKKNSAIYPGEYLVSGNMSIPEIALVITNPEKTYEKVLFKEGWTAKQMADELAAHGFSKRDFMEKINNPSHELISQFSILKDKPEGASLEGYLFPDTYYFSKEATTEGIIKKILSNTEQKISGELIKKLKDGDKGIFRTLILASIVEKEMANASEANMIASVFQNRLSEEMLLQSDATLTYVLEDKEDQHSLSDLELDSPYNTYKYKELPPGPIANPGMDAILAAINPRESEYFFFLTITESGKKKTIFAKTFQEHVANRAKYGM